MVAYYGKTNKNKQVKIRLKIRTPDYVIEYTRRTSENWVESENWRPREKKVFVAPGAEIKSTKKIFGAQILAKEVKIGPETCFFFAIFSSLVH